MAIIPLQSVWPNVIMLFVELFIAGIVLFYAWSINRFVVPLKDFQVVAQGLGIALKTTMLKDYKGPRVIQETAEAMNKMQQRIKDLVHDRTLMLAAISHDLKTPITRLKLRAHLLENTELRQDVLRDLDDMETMISELMVFSKNENITEHRQKLELNSFIETLCHELSDMGLDVTFHRAEARVIYPCRKVAFKRSLNNIIQNAVKYGQTADVYLEKTKDKLNIHVDDQGPGIKEEEFEKVFSPFYRLDHSRSRNIAGTGLGMAIARSAIRSHGGDITLENRLEGGLRVTFAFPL
jgi:signal transduction histidine kinase